MFSLFWMFQDNWDTFNLLFKNNILFINWAWLFALGTVPWSAAQIINPDCVIVDHALIMKLIRQYYLNTLETLKCEDEYLYEYKNN